MWLRAVACRRSATERWTFEFVRHTVGGSAGFSLEASGSGWFRCLASLLCGSKGTLTRGSITCDSAEVRRGRAVRRAAVSQPPGSPTPPLHVNRSGPPSSSGADGAPPDSLRLTPLRCTSAPSFALTYPYLELVCGPMLGPVAVLVARNLARHQPPPPIAVSVVAIALELCLGSSHDEPLGRNSPRSPTPVRHG